MILETINRDDFRSLKLSCYNCKKYERIRKFGGKKVLQCECSYTIIPPYVENENQLKAFYSKLSSVNRFKVIATEEGYELSPILIGDVLVKEDKVLVIKVPSAPKMGGY